MLNLRVLGKILTLKFSLGNGQPLLETLIVTGNLSWFPRRDHGRRGGGGGAGVQPAGGGGRSAVRPAGLRLPALRVPARLPGGGGEVPFQAGNSHFLSDRRGLKREFPENW